MPEYVRAREVDTGHVVTIAASAAAHGYEVLDEPALCERTGDPLPTVYATAESAPESPVGTTSGRKANTLKEKANA